MELHELEVGKPHAPARGRGKACAARVAGFVVRSKQAPMPPVATTTCGDSTASRAPVGGLEQDAADARPQAMMSTSLEAFQPADVGPAETRRARRA